MTADPAPLLTVADVTGRSRVNARPSPGGDLAATPAVLGEPPQLILATFGNSVSSMHYDMLMSRLRRDGTAYRRENFFITPAELDELERVLVGRDARHRSP
ncbi:hypothetical protein [Microbacterium sp. NPDC089695]|uniref:hypothetical protein n=1 Tax=Microbacterium sp. NPDC089695 TaxID=3364198 RepID=UPI0038175DE6